MELSESKIDWHQVKALLRAAIKTDLRGSSNPMNTNRARSSRIPPIVGLMIFKGFIALGLAGFAFALKNPFMASFLVLTIMMVFMSLTILLEFSNLILSPDEYRIVSHLPIGSKTFFISKLIHLLVYVNVLASILYIPSAVTVSIAGHNFYLFFSFITAGLLAATTTGMAFVVLYTMLLKIINREAMQRVAGYAQLVLISLVYFCWFALPRLFSKNAFGMLKDFDASWIYLAPPAWFGALAKLPAGGITAYDIYASLAGIIVLLIFFRAGLSRLSLGYAQTLSSTVAQQDKMYQKKKQGLISKLTLAISNSEDRAVWKLIQKQFKYDNRFKMSILTIIPLTAFYVYMGISSGKTIADPFVISFHTHTGGPNILLYMAVAMLPFMITINTAFSDSYQSAWVFFTSPADRTRIVLSSARFALYYFCFPFTILLLFLFSWFFKNYFHALLHCILIFVILMIMTKVMVLLYPRIPFSQIYKKGSSSVSFIMMFIVLIVVTIPMVVISTIGYGGYRGYGIYLVIALIINFVFQIILKKEIPGRVEKLEF